MHMIKFEKERGTQGAKVVRCTRDTRISRDMEFIRNAHGQIREGT